jgi:polysaccharide chain length determinant protein (PEP-CTERM system associated)
MLQNGEISPIAIKRAVRRFWWIPFLCCVACGALALLAIKVLPKKYTSKTAVMVEQPTVPTDYVKPVISEDVYQRLASMQGEILSNSRLLPIIDKFGLYSKDREKVSPDVLVGKLRESVKITPLAATPGMEGRGPLPGFYVNVTFDDPRLAQQICAEVTSMFLEQNVRRRIAQAQDTTQFLAQELDEAKQKLDAEDEKLATFKRQYLGSLPEEEPGNLNILTSLNTQLEATTQGLSRAQQDKGLNEALLSQQLETWKATLAGQRNTETLEQQLSALQDQLEVMLSKYTPEHPDVVKLQNQIADLKKRIQEGPKSTSVPKAAVAMRETPQIQQLRAKIHQDELNIVELAHRQTQLEDEIRRTQGRVQASPMVELQLKELTRNYQTALDFYKDLLRKRENSAMATNLEHQQESEQFTILDQANLPKDPSFPDPFKFKLGGFGGGFALGIAILGLIVYRDKCLYTERNVEANLKLAVLASIPSFHISNVANSRLKSADLTARIAPRQI